MKLFDGSERAFVGHDGAVTAVALTDAVIVSGGRDRTVRIWDRASGHAQVIDIFAGPIEGVHSPRRARAAHSTARGRVG